MNSPYFSNCWVTLTRPRPCYWHGNWYAVSTVIADVYTPIKIKLIYSFTGMFIAIWNIVTSINIYTYDYDTSNPILNDWYKDGTVEYEIKSDHLILMILTIVVVGPVLLSYMTILVAIQPLMKAGSILNLVTIYRWCNHMTLINITFFVSL